MPIYFDVMNKNWPFAIESIGNDWYQEDINRPNGHPYYHWLQTNEGVGEVQLADQKILLPAGSGLLLSPFLAHRYYRKSNAAWKTSFVTVNGRFLERMHEILSDEAFIFVSDGQFFSQWIDKMISHIQKRDATPKDFSIATYAFLLELSQRHPSQPPLENKLFADYLKPTITYIETHFSEDISVEQLAKIVFITPQYLNRLFQRFFHLTTTQYIRQFRLKKAKELLINKNEMEIQLLAELVGFKSSSHFIASFKKATGYTPLAFRLLYV
ncbi:AraC family transcriptional regulator [Enterococcus timonensis]|uniref:AraC family transcriptional regulator n=1 Tax=Enterococcus timonensis TaxID=1852364 RepID=UPI0008DA1061|nr:AraC family transcriptional regulator [Enterococcus timonensis]